MELGDARRQQDGSTAADANKKPLKVYLQKTIGKGSFGHVRYCKAVVGNKPVGFAVKIICKYSSKYQFNRGLVDREVSILKKLQHPNLITFIRLLDNQYYVYMYMEYCKYYCRCINIPSRNHIVVRIICTCISSFFAHAVVFLERVHKSLEGHKKKIGVMSRGWSTGYSFGCGSLVRKV